MKKLLLALLAIASFGIAQSQVIFYEDFDGMPNVPSAFPGIYSFPSGWLLRNVDNRTPEANVAYVNEAWERREDFKHNITDSAAFSTSYYSPSGAADDWMWTPLIGPLPENSVLSWNAVTYDPNYRDGYEVRIIVSPSFPTGGTGVIGNQVSSSTVLFSISEENTSWTSRSVDLNAYVGQSVYIGFRNNSNDKFILAIDDIKVEVLVQYDAALVSTDTITEYSMTPLSQATSLNFSGNIRNDGLMALSNVQLNVDVRNSAETSVYSASSTPLNLTPGASHLFTVAPFLPVAADTYTVRYYVSADEADQRQSNDTLYDSFMITDSVYARDKGAVNHNLGIGAGSVGYLGQDFEIISSDDLTSVTMYFARGYTGRRCAAVIWDMKEGIPNTIIAGTDTILYTNDNAGYYTLGIHGGPVSLAPGRYAVTAIEFDSVLTLGTTSEIFTPGRTWVNWTGNSWTNNEDFGSLAFLKSFVIRPNFGNIIISGTDLSITSSEEIEVYPNPSAGSFIVSAINEGTYLIYNDLGQIVKTISLGATDNSTIVIDDLNNGVYLISGVSGNKVVKKKIIVTK